MIQGRTGEFVERDPSLDGGDDQCQPCGEFLHEPGMFGRTTHQCPLCEGWRSFCHNCYTDHHEGGWNKCNHDPSGEEPRKCGRQHPLCLAAMSKEV